ncbi:C-C motif chemokine 22 [Cynocephalus volans]|uniref:C-C motif chemokine 22 n=1 Tax=Cynocephalus volans TaxID=110931 RepID=UPI002FC80BFB
MAGLQAPILAALVLLAVALQATEAGPYGANVEDSICCRSYIRHPLPLRMLKYFYWTSDSCRRPGVVLLTARDREICADPRMPWVKKILDRLNK